MFSSDLHESWISPGKATIFGVDINPDTQVSAIEHLRIILATSILVFGGLSFLTAQNLSPLPQKKLLRDFDEAVAFIEAHPAPYRRINEQDHTFLVDSLRNEITSEMHLLDFYRLVSSVYAAIHDGHSSIGFPAGWMRAHYKRNGIFPYRVYLNASDQLFLVRNYGSDSTIAEGTQVVAINGLEVPDFLARVDPYISYETPNFRNALIGRSFNFYVFLAFGTVERLEITYQAGDVVRTHPVRFVSYRGWEKELDDEQDRIQSLIRRGEPFEYSKVTEGIGFLRIHSFSGFSGREFDFFLDRMMRRIHRDSLHSLIIDVRGNTGGATYAVADVMQRLTKKEFKTSARSEMKVSQAIRDYFNDAAPHVNWYQAQARQFRHAYSPGMVFQKDIGEYIVTQDLYKEEAPSSVPYQFEGELYMLVDGTSFSAASSLAAVFRCYQLGLIVGTPTGGTRVFHANNIYKMLRHSKLRCTMATTRIYTPCFTNERDNVHPDLEVEPTIHHLLAGRDAALDYTVHLARKAQKVKAEHAGQ